MNRDLRLGACIILANLAITTGGVFAIDALRQTAMAAAHSERLVIQKRLDAAWRQRERLARETVGACRR